MKFRKKPVVIEAVQLTWEEWGGVCELVGKRDRFIGGALGADGIFREGQVTKTGMLAARIPTLEGDFIAREGDWIIKGVAGEIYPCKPEIFAATYEPADRKEDIGFKKILLIAYGCAFAVDVALHLTAWFLGVPYP